MKTLKCIAEINKRDLFDMDIPDQFDYLVDKMNELVVQQNELFHRVVFGKMTEDDVVRIIVDRLTEHDDEDD